MAKNKKPAKSFKPRDLYLHPLIGNLGFFGPIRKALDILRNHGKLISDENGVVYLLTPDMGAVGFGKTLNVVVEMGTHPEIVQGCNKLGSVWCYKNISQLAQQLNDRVDYYDAALLLAVAKELDCNEKILARLPAHACSRAATSIRISKLI